MKYKKTITALSVPLIILVLGFVSFKNAQNKSKEFVNSFPQDYSIYSSRCRLYSLNPDMKGPRIYWSFCYDHNSILDQGFNVETTIFGKIVYPTQEQIEYWISLQK